MDGENSTASPALRLLKQVGAWIALAVVLVVGVTIWSGFQTSLHATSTSTLSAASAVATPSADASATSMVAVTRVDGVRLRSADNTGAQVLSIVKKGTTLQVLNRTDAWLRVKDPIGHIGWVENSIKTVEIRKK